VSFDCGEAVLPTPDTALAGRAELRPGPENGDDDDSDQLEEAR
jgi:hypothetical protein